MRNSLLIGILSILITAPVRAEPKLLVVVVVDQMRGDYIERFGNEFQYGLDRLVKDGAQFTNTHLKHVPADTATGHATLLTGRYPAEHGITGNQVWDWKKESVDYTVFNSSGIKSPENLLESTVGDILKENRPQSKVVSVSYKDRGAIFLGGQKADAAVWFEKGRSEFQSSKYYPDHSKWLSAFNKRLPAMGVPPAKSDWETKAKFLESGKAIDVLTVLAESAVNEFKLGTDIYPDLLTISYSGTDYLGHRVGPDANELPALYKELDRSLGELIDFLESEVGQGEVTLVLTSDHGVMPLPENHQSQKHPYQRLLNQDAFKQIKAAVADPIEGGDKYIMAFSGPHLFVDLEKVKEDGLNPKRFLKQAARAIRKLDWVDETYLPNNFVPDDYNTMYARSHHPERGGQIMVRWKEGVLLYPYSTGTNHGTPYDYDTHIPLIFWGHGINPGLFGRRTAMNDLAPTLAGILRLPFFPSYGSRELNEALSN